MWECICRFNPYPSFISGIIKDLVMLILVNSFYASSRVWRIIGQAIPSLLPVRYIDARQRCHHGTTDAECDL